MIVFDIPAKTSIEQIKMGLRESISFRAQGFQENENFLPNPLPENPEQPQFGSNQSGRMGMFANIASGNPQFEMLRTNINNAYYSLKGTEKFGSIIAKKELAYMGAFYPAKNINRVYLIVYYQEGSAGITGGLAHMMTNAIVGEKGAIPFMLQVKEKFISYVPNAVISNSQPADLADYKLNEYNRVEKIN